MKKVLSLIIVFALVVGVIPINAFAYHEHYYEYFVGCNGQHPHAATWECECGEETTAPCAYMFDCSECIEELCYEHNLYDYYNFSMSEEDLINTDNDYITDEDHENLVEFCDELNLNIVNNSDTYFDYYHEKIDSLFSNTAKRNHPHSGYYETRDGDEVYLDFAYNPKCKLCLEDLCYEYNAHSCLDDYKIYDDHIRFICFCGKTTRVRYGAVMDRFEDFIGERSSNNEKFCKDINFDLAEEEHHHTYPTFDNSVDNESEYVEKEPVSSTLGGTFDGPQASSDGKVYISSNLTSNYQITSVYVYVVDSNGSKVRGAEITPYSKSVVIDKNSYLNQQLCLETLSTGTYDVYMEIKDSSGTTGSASANFNITQPDCKPAENSTLTITFTCLPEVIREKGGFGLRGEIVSNYTITSAYGYLKDMNDNVLDSSYDSPNSTYMDIKSAKLNQDLTFDILSNGRYKIVAIAYDASGAEVTLEHEFTVDRPSSANNSSSLIDGKYTVEQWNELFGHIIYYNNFEPCYMDVKTGDATIHITALDASDKIGYPAKGEILRITGKCKNKYNNVWYIVEGYNGIEKGFIYSGDLTSHSHKYEILNANNSVFKICDCGHCTVSSNDASTLKKSNSLLSLAMPIAGGAALADTPALGPGDAIAVVVLAGATLIDITGIIPTITELQDVVSEVDFYEYLKSKENQTNGPYRKVKRVGNELRYIDSQKMDAFQAYIYVRGGGDIYCSSWAEAYAVAAQHKNGCFSEIDKNQPDYFYHFHLGEKDINGKHINVVGGHIFYGYTPNGKRPH